MNMRKYYHLLALRRFKGLFISNRRCVHDQTSSAVKSHHLSGQPRQPPTSSAYSHITRNTYNRNAILSHHYLQATHFNLTRNYYDSQLSKLHTSQLELPEYEDEITTPLDYQVTIKGTEVVKAPATLGNKHWLPLSNLDLLLPPIEAGVFFCYKKKNNTDMSTETVVNKIKTSLAGVLSTFYPLAGEIVTNSQGEPEVVCNNGGVEFVHAHADIELKDMDFHHPDHSVKGKLIPKINHGVIAVQVNYNASICYHIESRHSCTPFNNLTKLYGVTSFGILGGQINVIHMKISQINYTLTCNIKRYITFMLYR